MLKSTVKFVSLFMGLILFCASPGMAKNTINWKTYDEGLALGRQDGKKIFVHFFADW